MLYEVLLPLITYPDANSEKVAANAVSVAKHLGADLHALAINVDIPDVSSALAGILLDLPEMIREAEAKSWAQGHMLLDAVEARASAAGVSLRTGAIAARQAEFGPVAASHARYHEISLVGWERDNGMARAVAEALIFESGRPVVLLPESAEVGVIDHVVIAWDGSRAAARAVSDAFPFLKLARVISVVTVMDEKPIREKDAAERLAEHLSKRGLPAKANAIYAEDCPIGETLQVHAQTEGAKLLVMGGFGHSRLREFVLGGATKDVLYDLRMPVLLSH